MSDDTQFSELAAIKESRRLSSVWLVPIIALGIGLWFVYYQLSNQGPMITIAFENAEGLEAGKTKIKAREVDIGLVKNIKLNEDLSGVVITAQMSKEAEDMLTENTEFWIVTPRISLSGVSGMSTLLSGPYINMEPSLEGDPESDFIARIEPPVTPIGTPGLHITLNSNDEFAFEKGDAVVYKGLKVGEFEDIYFNLEERVVYYNVFIEAPYHRLITKNTRFWNVSGINFELGANGLEVQAGSVETLLTNGVTFGVPEGMSLGERITERDYFDIYADYQAASDQRYKRGVKFALMIEDTVRGLKVGAPVEYRGLVIGQVVEINPEFYSEQIILDEGYSIPVIIEIQPGRVQQPDTDEGVEFVKQQTLHWIDRGFRATLETGNLLTGALYVDVDIYPEMAPPETLENFMNIPVIPTIPEEFGQITEKMNQILNKVNQMPLDDIGKNANQMLKQFSDTASSFEATSNNADKVIIAEMSKTLAEVNRLLADYQQGSVTNTEINRTMKSVQQLLGDLQPLIKQLNRAPNSLVFPPAESTEVEPKGNQ
ncbi:intermembrane transport protein PqiB [Pseudoteredinibacter isoporae]|uniref:Paraquat-inducible protein B n=1 Tax=Pseudoteredinibacter isoporae TaxID=570281 RepID=A0A7X0JQ89_9GAMM|nr:intermembrane transport protein PqiB [Pseudoteredinibacter isoporae]MBB6520299.1 paraquat-inducible protein B [Pseudoteredinibacter isoporae]NHO85870.1 intermembrane transport protein PqiB [Pseudoteredinibacter isoporae]NIB25678.1 intermembrane transport protein PqiB [Pseudoteredinibacter isoporae]